jgi:hypothetical protein
MVTAQDKPRSRLEEAPGAHEGAQVRDVGYRCDGCGAEVLRVVPCER